jgi:hypothetical protein
MNYERDYGNRNFLERAANTVRGWVGRHGGGDDRWYDDEYRGGPMNRGSDGDRGYREMGDVSGYRGGMDRGYGATNWRGYNDDWNRGMGGGWGRGGGDEYRTGGYNASHGGWDVDWDDSRMRGYGPDRGMNRGMGGGERDHYMGRDFMTNHPHFGHDWRSGHTDDATVDRDRGDWNRPGGMMGRGMTGGMNRGMQGGMDRGWDGDRGDWNRGGAPRSGRGYGADYGGGGMMGRDAGLGDAEGGMIGNYGAYGSYGIERFRSASGGGVPTGQYFRGYGVGSGYQP